MKFFEWSDNYLVGNDKIDFQHQNLVNMLNHLYDSSKEDPKTAQIAMGIFLEKLLDYTLFHFNTEEELMRSTAYPEFKEHQQQHEALKKKVVAYSQAFEQGNIKFQELVDFLKDWLVQHIGKSDKKLAAHLRNLE